MWRLICKRIAHLSHPHQPVVILLTAESLDGLMGIAYMTILSPLSFPESITVPQQQNTACGEAEAACLSRRRQTYENMRLQSLLGLCITPAPCAVQLFQHDGAPVAAAPPVYASTATPADMSDSNYHPPGGSGSAGFGGGGPANTLDEPVWETVKHPSLPSCSWLGCHEVVEA